MQFFFYESYVLVERTDKKTNNYNKTGKEILVTVSAWRKMHKLP